MKKNGGTIKDWQTHTLSISLTQFKELCPNATVDKAMIFTGTVVHDPAGRFRDGTHMRSSLIVDFDKKNGIIETENTIYKMEGEEGGDIFTDLGDAAMKIFY